MKKSVSMRSQLVFMMTLLVLFWGVALVSSLRLSKVFLLLDGDSFRLFNNATESKQRNLNREWGALIEQLAYKSQELSNTLEKQLVGEEDHQNIFRDQKMYQEATLVSGQAVIDLLNENHITGAFVFFTGSNAAKDDPTRHSGVYIRNAAPENKLADSNKFMLEIGNTFLAQRYTLPTGINWDLDIAFDKEQADTYHLYQKPIEAVKMFPGSEVKRYGYWSTPVSIMKDNQQSIYYTMPLVSSKQEVYGVMGFEISQAYFMKYFLPATENPFPNSFFTVVKVSEEDKTIGWFLPVRDLTQETFQVEKSSIALEEVNQQEEKQMFQTQLIRQGKTYVNLKKLAMYSDNSPFADTGWYVAGFVPKKNLHESSLQVRFALKLGIGVAFIIALGAIFFFAYFFTRKISGLSAYMKKLSPKEDIYFKKTGLLEIDELTSAIEKFNERVIDSSNATARIMEMTDLPLGGYEISLSQNQVTVTDYIHSLIGTESGTDLSVLQWKAYYNRLTTNPLQGYDNVYYLKEESGQPERWLRILESPSNNGFLGIIMDVTREIRENLRLTHFLDYDALTQLYNRNAYKREALKLMEKQPDLVGAGIFCDLDNLKFINDNYGHDMGDRYIIQAGEMFRKLTDYGGIVSRISGDEFAIYLHGFQSIEEARTLIYNFFSQNRTSLETGAKGGSHPIRFSSGIAWYPKDSRDILELMKQADFAMYEVKKRSRGSIHEFDPISYQENLYLLENREAINRLIDEQLVHFAFQPIVSGKTGEIVAYEALMRPLLEDFRSPMEILNVAAEQSKLNQLERMIILRVFETMQERWSEFHGRDIYINSIPDHS